MTGEELRQKRVELGLSTIDLANRLQVSSDLIEVWEGENKAGGGFARLLELAMGAVEDEIYFERKPESESLDQSWLADAAHKSLENDRFMLNANKEFAASIHRTGLSLDQLPWIEAEIARLEEEIARQELQSSVA